MTTFANPRFSHASYAAFRPSHPQSIYNTILSHLHGERNLCIDLGTGQGIAARHLAPLFQSVIGVDPSDGMIAQATSLTPSTTYRNVQFRKGTAEALPFVADLSADLIVAANAVHWFDQVRTWPEMGRCMRSGGLIAFWSYDRPVLVGRKLATEAMKRYVSSQEQWALGSYWPQPGANIVVNKLRSVKAPEGQWEEVLRAEYSPTADGDDAESGKRAEGLMGKRMKLGELAEYMRTWSAVHEWQEAHTGSRPSRDGGSGDVVDHMMDEMQKSETDWSVLGLNEYREAEVDVEWGGAIVLSRKR